MSLFNQTLAVTCPSILFKINLACIHSEPQLLQMYVPTINLQTRPLSSCKLIPYLKHTGSENIIIIFLKCVELEPQSFTLILIACCCCGYFFFFLTPIVLWSLLHPSSVWVQLLCDWHKQIPALMNRLTDLSSSCWVLRTLRIHCLVWSWTSLKVLPQLHNRRIFEMLTFNHGYFIFSFLSSSLRCSLFLS